LSGRADQAHTQPDILTTARMGYSRKPFAEADTVVDIREVYDAVGAHTDFG
jgi:hypothetical protein